MIGLLTIRIICVLYKMKMKKQKWRVCWLQAVLGILLAVRWLSFSQRAMKSFSLIIFSNLHEEAVARVKQLTNNVFGFVAAK